MARDRETYRGYRRNLRFGRPAHGNNTRERREAIWRATQQLAAARNSHDGEAEALVLGRLAELRRET